MKLHPEYFIDYFIMDYHERFARFKYYKIIGCGVQGIVMVNRYNKKTIFWRNRT